MYVLVDNEGNGIIWHREVINNIFEHNKKEISKFYKFFLSHVL